MLNRCLLPVIVMMVLCLTACDKTSPAAPNASTSPTVIALVVTGNTTLGHKGETAQLRAVVQFSDGTEADVTATARWTTGDPSIATISATGLLTAGAPGKCKVNAESQDSKGERDVEVQDPAALRSLAIQGDPSFTSPGQTQQLQSIGTFGDGGQQDMSGETTWSSSDPNVATVSDRGLVTSRGPGQCDILATVRSLSARVKSTVTIKPTALRLRITGDATLSFPGLSSQLRAFVVLSDGSENEVTDKATWSSDRALVATISAAGMLRGLLPGTCNILAVYGDLRATAEASVLTPVIERLTITGTLNLLVGATSQLKAFAHMSDGTDVDVTDGTAWSADDLLIALVSKTGLVTGLTLGKCEIVGVHAGVTAKAVVNVRLF